MNLSWDDAKRYVAWLSRITGKPYRLLSESEWEYAARAGTATRYSFGDDEAALVQHAWYGNPNGQTHLVGEKAPNAFGLYDMHGNVFEWVEDCWNANYDGAPVDGAPWTMGGCNFRVVRGGTWNDNSAFLRSASRYRYPTDNRYNDLGFRVGRTLTP